jgi:tetratricopeptide (TPR) repeat protein
VEGFGRCHRDRRGLLHRCLHTNAGAIVDAADCRGDFAQQPRGWPDGQFEYGEARDIFARLASGHPDNLDLQVNLAIATLHRQGEGDPVAAQRLLEQVLVKSAEHLRARYNLGLLLLHDGHAAEALPHLSLVAARDPENAFAQYFVAQCRFQQSEFTGALAAYERAFTLNPRLRQRGLRAFQSRQRLARPDAPQMLEAFRALEANPQSEVAEFKVHATRAAC